MDRNLKTSDSEEIIRNGLSQMREEGYMSVPVDLSAMIERTVDLETGRRRSRMRLAASLSSLAAAAAIAAVALIVPVNTYEPKDTFDDPALAYAETVRALEMVGVNLNKGLVRAGQSAGKAGDMVSETMESVYDKVNKK